MTSDYRPDAFTINNVLYYFADDIKSCFPDIFKGIGDGSVYDLIKIKDLKRTEYIHAYYHRNSWIFVEIGLSYTNLLLSKEWVDDFVKKNNCVVCSLFKSSIELDEIVLNNDEKITDENGVPLKIHIVRDKKNKLMYFNMIDIINCNSEMCNYYNNITYYLTNKRRQHIYNRPTRNKPLISSSYFTYYGILAFMTKGKSFPFLKRLDEWIRKINFTKNTDLRYQSPSVPIGVCVSEENEELSKKSLNSQLFIKTCDTLNTLTTMTSAVYLLELGRVQDLRYKLNISNDVHGDLTVYKYGKTYSIKHRFKDEYDYYKRTYHIDAKLVKYTITSCVNLDELESTIINSFARQGFTMTIVDECVKTLIVINSTQLIKVYSEFTIDNTKTYGITTDIIKHYDSDSEIQKNALSEKIIDEVVEEVVEKVVEKTEIEAEEEVVEEEEEEEETVEENVETVEEVDNFIQKTKIENEKEDDSVFKCIIDWFEYTLTYLCC